MKYGIVVIAYNNLIGTKRLLNSLSKIDNCGINDILLIISIDFSGNDSIKRIADEYEWIYGPKIVKAYSKNLGLRTHIMSCGDYMNQYELDAVAILEDDILVSPAIVSFMKNAVPFYMHNDSVAGISLYKHELNIYAKHPFIDYNDGGDTYFVQYAQSWGQIWIRDKWNDFILWYNNKEYEKLDLNKVPGNILKWNNSWLKYHIMYCISKNLYFVYPRVSLTTNNSDIGTHNSFESTKVQVPILHSVPEQWKLNTLHSTKAVYDSFFENTRINEFLHLDNLEVDLYGVKSIDTDCKYIVTRKKLPYKIEGSWGLALRPIEENIFSEIPGQTLFLYDTTQKKHNSFEKQHSYRLFEYDLKGIQIVSHKSLTYAIRYSLLAFNAKYKRLLKKLKKKK